jgi:hypothetical protein
VLVGVLDGALAAAAALDRTVDGLDERVGEAHDVVGLHQPAGLPVADDRGGAERIDGDRRSRAGHRLDDDLAELLADRREHEDVGGGEEVRQLLVAVPAGQEDVLRAGARDRVERVLALPLAGEAAEQHERRPGGEAGPGALVGLDQQR